MAQSNPVWTINGKSIDSLRVVDLKEQLKQRNLPCTGIKDVLKTRLKSVGDDSARETRNSHWLTLGIGSGARSKLRRRGNQTRRARNGKNATSHVDAKLQGALLLFQTEDASDGRVKADTSATTPENSIDQSEETRSGAKRTIRALSETEREVAEMELDYTEMKDDGTIGGRKGRGGDGSADSVAVRRVETRGKLINSLSFFFPRNVSPGSERL